MNTITAVYSTRHNHSWTFQFWHKSSGFFMEEVAERHDRVSTGNRLFHGKVAWATVEGEMNRVEVAYDEPTKEFVFPGVFRARGQERKQELLTRRAANKAEADARFAQTGQPPQSKAHAEHAERPAAVD